MALLDLEPPSSQKTNEEKNQNLKSTKLLITTNLYDLKSKLVFFVAKLLNIGSAISSFYKNNVRLLPHFAIILLLITVVVSNLTETAKASTLFMDFTAPNPDEEAAVTSQVDEFTPLIQNDATVLEKYFTAQANPDGFASSIAPVSTQLTMRTEPLPDNNASEVTYLVKGGDVLSVIAMQFDVKTSTLKYLNDLASADAIKPGMKLKIPKKGYEVPQSLIAKKEADRQKKLALASRNTVSRDSSRNIKVNTMPGASSNAYPYGWCTYYVATRRYVPGNWGNAKSWLGSAKRSGYSIGRTPAAGAIMVSAESWLGHVAYVESVNGDTFTISEMNARGWGVKSSRTIRADYGKILGFVY